MWQSAFSLQGDMDNLEKKAVFLTVHDIGNNRKWLRLKAHYLLFSLFVYWSRTIPWADERCRSRGHCHLGATTSAGIQQQRGCLSPTMTACKREAPEDIFSSSYPNAANTATRCGARGSTLVGTFSGCIKSPFLSCTAHRSFFFIFSRWPGTQRL